MVPRQVDVIVVGSGMAGLVTALMIEPKWHVLVLTKKGKADSNTNFAQGGIAAAVGNDDAPERHLVDTLRGGAGLCHVDVVKEVVENGPAAVGRLYRWGVDFSRSPDGIWDLGREGGHSRRRIVHALDRTGKEIEMTLLSVIKERRNVILLEDILVSDIQVDRECGRVRGVVLLDERGEQAMRRTVGSTATVLATGGAGYVYQFTSNPEIATGDGISLGFRAGVAIRNLEFVQFHPTTFYSPSGESFLISEAVRGEGAKLVLPDGGAFMKNYDSRGELAPRDIVARAIDGEMRAHQIPYVLLDATILDSAYLRRRFPQINGKCLNVGIDFAVEPIPVVPAAHYMCGGLRTDLDGATSVEGLFACGEVAHTGLHGANRLASNSLLEAVVFAERVAKSVNKRLAQTSPIEETPETEHVVPPLTGSDDELVVELRGQIRRCMWAGAGIVRSDTGLAGALHELVALKGRVRFLIESHGETRATVELRNMADVAELITRSAAWRKESRGLHYNLDHPGRGDKRWRRDSEILSSKNG